MNDFEPQSCKLVIMYITPLALPGGVLIFNTRQDWGAKF